MPERFAGMSAGPVFSRIAQRAAQESGRPWAFVTAIAVVLLWAVTGPVFRYSDTWQLVINTGTTVVTFLMVFLIQNAQNRDTQAIQLKLDELIRATEGAHNRLIALESQSEEVLQEVREELSASCEDLVDGKRVDAGSGRAEAERLLAAQPG